jgi:hypothetical protein
LLSQVMTVVHQLTLVHVVAHIQSQPFMVKPIKLPCAPSLSVPTNHNLITLFPAYTRRCNESFKYTDNLFPCIHGFLEMRSQKLAVGWCRVVTITWNAGAKPRPTNMLKGSLAYAPVRKRWEPRPLPHQRAVPNRLLCTEFFTQRHAKCLQRECIPWRITNHKTFSFCPPLPLALAALQVA